ncbi:hypothetical protein B0A49_02800 [Cryomyces minteri]|uniref:AB hydrolase-1 domain-containing protein n=1 Tax=Cryomyces minteri TaxID=331657 RepID=A0A4U0XRD8_9PEZI|nr:hypothetical protein B0A49_02800 [Cryomyces minteri]
MRLGPEFTDFDIETDSEVQIHGVKGGSGPPLLLLHGFPQTHLIWNKSYTVVAIDLRGYGASSKPHGDDKHIAYSKRVMARDCVRVMEYLGHSRFFLCGHDRGARVGHALLTTYPSAAIKAIFLDISPTLKMFDSTDQQLATAYYHWFFLIQPSPFPEDMILASPRLFAEKSLLGLTATSIDLFGPDAFAAYVAGLSDPASVHAMCEDYRAAATVDLDDARADEREGRRIGCPLRVLWGAKGVIEKCFDAVKDWSEVAEEGMVDKGSGAVGSGHYIPEEVPEELLGHVREFLVDG